MKIFKHLFWGIIARLLYPFVKIQSKVWVFGSDYGNMYREGSKYLLEFVKKNHPEIKCIFITQNEDVVDTLTNNGVECYKNHSWRGILSLLQADSVFTTQSVTDVLFAFKKVGKHYYYLVHGQPLKYALNMLPSMNKRKHNFIDFLKGVFMFDYSFSDISFVSSCSDFLAQFQRKEFDASVDIKVLGMPRNDALFDSERMKKENWIKEADGKFVITYMPTHRAYGKGAATPTPFINRQDIQSWLRENNILFVMKNHPNMIPQIDDSLSNEVIVDITKRRLDPQVCLYHSDVLITDFSSVWMDYLLLRRPLLFYIYDDFEHDDVGTYYDLREDAPGHFCSSEEELFQLIKRIKENYTSMCPSDRIVNKYHKYVDGNTCSRYFNEIYNQLYNN